MKYIDAEKLKEIVDRVYKQYEYDYGLSAAGSNMRWIYDAIDSLQQEQLEADLEKEIDRYCAPIQAWQIQEAPYTSIEKCARHFYELGLKANKEK